MYEKIMLEDIDIDTVINDYHIGFDGSCVSLLFINEYVMSS